MCYKSRDAFVQPAFFLAGNRARNGVAVVAFKNMFTTSLHKDFQSGISLNLRTAPTGHATLFNQ